MWSKRLDAGAESPRGAHAHVGIFDFVRRGRDAVMDHMSHKARGAQPGDRLEINRLETGWTIVAKSFSTPPMTLAV